MIFQLLTVQQEKIAEQERIIRHLREKVGGRRVRVEDVEIIALKRLPKLVENVASDDISGNDDSKTVNNEKSDNDSAIHLDRSYDLMPRDVRHVSRHLQRSVSDVVQTHHSQVSPFCDKIYRGFLLRHQRRHRHNTDRQSISHRQTGCLTQTDRVSLPDRQSEE